MLRTMMLTSGFAPDPLRDIQRRSRWPLHQRKARRLQVRHEAIRMIRAIMSSVWWTRFWPS
jgi:hypothetical protein